MMSDTLRELIIAAQAKKREYAAQERLVRSGPNEYNGRYAAKAKRLWDQLKKLEAAIIQQVYREHP